MGSGRAERERNAAMISLKDVFSFPMCVRVCVCVCVHACVCVYMCAFNGGRNNLWF